MATKVLIVDDDKNICELLRLYLEKDGFETVCAYDGREALARFEDFAPDFILLDLMLPYIDGIQVCRTIRERSNVPVIMLTARGETADKIAGLDTGADDYVTKPFEPKEVIARIHAVLRRSLSEQEETDGNTVTYDNMIIKMSRYELWLKGENVYTPPKELELLHFLASNPGRVFTRDQLLDAVWGFDYIGDTRTVDVHIKRLRYKLEGLSDKWSLRTVWGVGYKFEVMDENEEEPV